MVQLKVGDLVRNVHGKYLKRRIIALNLKAQSRLRKLELSNKSTKFRKKKSFRKYKS